MRHFKSLINISVVENKKGKKIKIIRSDRGKEYFPTEFNKSRKEHGLIHQVLPLLLL